MIKACSKSRDLQKVLSHHRWTICSLGTLHLFLVLLPPQAIAQVGSEDPIGGAEPIPSRAEVSRAITLAGAYLERACGPDGRFKYEVDISTGKEVGSYNIVRHAGAIYALSMLNRSQPSRQAVDAMVRAAAYLRHNYIGPGVRPGMQVVWSKPLPRPSYAELGATGLSLVALVEVERARPKSVPLEQLQALGRFALFLQRDDGSFVDKYRAKSGPVPDWESLYYPGEAALGFVSLYEADHSREWLIAAGKALSYLARSRAGLSTVPADHWALIATTRLLPYCEQGACQASREELVRHAVQVCNSILREQFRGSVAAGIDGAFDPTGRTAPAATRLEGLLAALAFLRKGELPEKIEAAIARGIAFLLRAQISSGPYAGGLPGAVLNRAHAASQIRVDYVQHALCAWLRYENSIQRNFQTQTQIP